MNEILVFIAAGGSGQRLQKSFPLFRKSGLPKSLGIVINGRPILSYQLDSLIKLPKCQIVVAFNDKKSIQLFQGLVRKGKIPRYNYFLNIDSGDPDMRHIDLLKLSHPHKPWKDPFEKIIISSGDIFFNPDHILKLIKLSNLENCCVYTISDFKRYMVRLKQHYQPLYNNSNTLIRIKIQKEVPREVVHHPYLLTEGAFKFYYKNNTSKSIFLKKIIQKGERIKVLKPKVYLNINQPQDVVELRRYFSSVSFNSTNY